MNMSKPISGSTVATPSRIELPEDAKRKLLKCVEGLTPNQCAIVLKLIHSMDRLAKVKRANN